MGFNFNMSFGKLPNYVERDRSGNFFYSFLDNLFGNGKDAIKDKTCYTLESPALLIVKKFIADTGSLCKINSYENGKLKQEDYLYDIAERPNPFQTWTEFIWQYLFYASSDNAYLYNQNGVVYFLRQERIILTDEQKKAFKQLYFSSSTKKSTLRGNFKYKEENDKETVLKLENLYIIDVMSGVSGDWFNGSSTLHTLKGIVDNSNSSITSKRKNLFFTQKFMASGQSDPNNVYYTPMSEGEQKSIEQSLTNSNKSIHSVKSKVQVDQLVSNLKNLALDDAFNADFAKITRMFNIPNDLLDLVVKGGVFNEGRETSLAMYVYYNLVPLLQKLTDTLEIVFDKEDLRPSFNHVPFMKVFEVKNQEQKATKLANLKLAQELGLDEATVQAQLKLIYTEI